MRSVLALLCVFTFAGLAAAEPVVVVTATRAEQPERTVGSSSTVVTAEEIERLQATNAIDVLRTIPGLDVVQNGTRGGTTSVFIRGANPEHTLVLIDGVVANNPINPTRAYNFSDLNIDNIERIEVIRGPQSTLYGSDAMGGVIAIVTKKGAGEPAANFSVEAGAYKTSIERASVGGSSETVSYSAAYSRTDTDGFSSASGGDESDGYYENSASFRLAYDPSTDIGIDLIGRYMNSLADLDDGGGEFLDDPNRRLDQEQAFLRSALRAKGFDGRLEQIYGVSMAHHRFDDDDTPDANQPTELLESAFSGKTLVFDTQQTLHISDEAKFLFGAETKEERGWSSFRSDGDFGPFETRLGEQTARTNAAYGELLFNVDETYFLAAGLRHDHHSESEGETTWRIAPRVAIQDSGTDIFGSIGTAFKAPSLFQLYSEFGSPDLEPEKSLGLDFGVGQSLLDELLYVEVSYFQNEFEELITFEPNTFVFENIDEAKTSGIESSLALQLSEALRGNLSYTYLDTEDEATDDRLLRRARHRVVADISYGEADCFSVTARMRYVGNRIDNDFSTFPAARTELGGYTLFDILGTVSVNEDVEIFGRAENIFDKEYEEVLGFGTAGASVFAGVRVRL